MRQSAILLSPILDVLANCCSAAVSLMVINCVSENLTLMLSSVIVASVFSDLSRCIYTVRS